MTDPQPFPRYTLLIGEAKFGLTEGQRYVVGRSESCELRINHATVSDRHCLLICENAEVVVEDLGSDGGTRIDGTAVQRQLVETGQKIGIGSIELSLHDASLAPVVAPLRQPGDPKLRFRETSFAELMAEELRRAPWFTLSAALHALVLLILYHLMDLPPTTGERNLTIEMDRESQNPAVEELASPPEEEIREEEEILEQMSNSDPFEPDVEVQEQDLEAYDFSASGLSGGTNWLQNIKGKDKGILGHAAVRAGGFGKTVSEIRRSGLEIVFVFDSTGSMDSILQGTKRRIAHMFELLHELVPDARIGLVTYRDRDPSEAYLTRSVPLTPDVYRAINFMQVIQADGGGNRAEAVLDGLRQAFQQKWHPKARRVVVLIGDAPAHRFDEQKIKSSVRAFIANGRSFVHAIVTSPYGSNALEADTQKSFGFVAKAGKGECIGFENENRVLQQVMTLAFGREFRKNLDEASRIVQDRKSKVAPFALSMVRSKNFEKLEKSLREGLVSDEVVKALSRSFDKDVASFLVDMLSKRDLGQSGRQAATYALSRMMNGRLSDAIDRILVQTTEDGGARRKPWKLAPLTSREAKRLRRLIHVD